MEKYYLIYGRRLVKGISSNKDCSLASTAYEYVEDVWKEIDVNEINDRLVGYDPSEEGPYAMENMDIMDEIEEISEADLEKYMKNRGWLCLF